MPMLIFPKVETFENVIHNSIATCSGSVHQCIRESKMRTSNLIILYEDTNSIGYEHSKTKVCMMKMMAPVHGSFKCANRNNLCYYLRVSDMCVSWLFTCALKCAEAYGNTEVKSVKVMGLWWL